MSSQKDRVIKAVENFQKRQDKLSEGPKRKNKHPERLVESECLHWLRLKGFSVQIVESKYSFSEKAGRYISASTRSGTSDCFGSTPDGIGVFIEFKAKGRLYTIKEHQLNFLREKINVNCFAVVVDSAKLLSDIYDQWLKYKNAGHNSAARNLLLSLLPVKKSKDDGPLFPLI